MNRIELIPSITADGRHLILHAVVVTPRQRLLRLAVRVRQGRGRR